MGIFDLLVDQLGFVFVGDHQNVAFAVAGKRPGKIGRCAIEFCTAGSEQGCRRNGGGAASAEHGGDLFVGFVVGDVEAGKIGVELCA